MITRTRFNNASAISSHIGLSAIQVLKKRPLKATARDLISTAIPVEVLKDPWQACHSVDRSLFEDKSAGRGSPS